MLKIAHLTVSHPLILAPMAGITDLPFRTLNRSFGCTFAFAEMISARALVYGSEHTEKMLSTLPSDRPLGMQLLGNDPVVMRKAMEILREYPFDLIDLNAACPVSKVTKRGEGAGMLREPRRLGEVLKVMVRHAPVPVTVKIRSGWDETRINAVEVACYAEDAGISALFIHGRTREQEYRGRVDYRIIREVKNALQIPVVASGDILSPELIKKMFDETGCDGVSIARGALGNPWIFKEATEFLETGRIPERPSIHELADIMIRHLDLYSSFYGEKAATILFRKFFGWYAKGIPHMNSLRDKAFRAETKECMQELIQDMRAALH
jgi:tRNA-dihydrouridine synthase B